MKDIETRNRLVVEYKHIADKIASQKKGSCVYGVLLSELKSAAYMGLIDAASKYDESKGCKFAIYAKYRIYGAINDYLRSYYGTRRKHRMRGWSLDVPTYTNNNLNTIPLAESSGYEDDSLYSVDNADAIAKLFSVLPVFYSKLLKLYYIDDLTMREISELIKVPESYVSQLISNAKDTLREKCNVNPYDLFSIPKNQKINFISTVQESKNV